MLFVWVISFVIVIVLSILNMFFELPKIFLMVFGIFSMLPILFPIIDFIKKDEQEIQKILTIKGVFGLGFLLIIVFVLFFGFKIEASTLVFLMATLTGVYFAIDARWYFMFGIFFLGITILSLILNYYIYAEIFSIFLYYSLVAGVLVEILGEFFKKFHIHSREIISVSSEFIAEYKKEIGVYLIFFINISFCVLIGIMLAMSYGIWKLSDEILMNIVLILSVMIIFRFALLARKNESIVVYYKKKISSFWNLLFRDFS